MSVVEMLAILYNVRIIGANLPYIFIHLAQYASTIGSYV